MGGLLCGATFLAALGSGLVAGAFFAFSAYIMPALSHLAPVTAIASMQAIMAAIRGPLFLIVFFGTAIIAFGLGIVATLSRWSQPDAIYLLLGSLFYLSLPLGVTLLRNLPLNDQLAAVTADGEAGARVWKAYQPAWTWWNHVRTAGALAAAASFILALVRQGVTA